MNLKYKFIKAQTLNQSSITTITTLQARHTTNQPNLKVEKKPNERIFQKPKSHLSLSLSQSLLLYIDSIPFPLCPLKFFSLYSLLIIYIFFFVHKRKGFPRFRFSSGSGFSRDSQAFPNGFPYPDLAPAIRVIPGWFIFFFFFKFKNQLVFVCVWLLS